MWKLWKTGLARGKQVFLLHNNRFHKKCKAVSKVISTTAYHSKAGIEEGLGSGGRKP